MRVRFTNQISFGKDRAIFLPRTSSVQRGGCGAVQPDTPRPEEKNLNYVIPRVNQTGSKGSERRG